MVCATLFKIIDPANLQYCRDNADDASAIWSALKKAHQDSSTGGKVYWMQKLVNAKMEGDDIHAHINHLAKFHKHLNALVTADKPLTPDDRKPWQCPLCNTNSHDLHKCRNARQLISDHKAQQRTQWEKEQNSNPTPPPARAGRTSAATLGKSSQSYEGEDDSDFSGSEIEVTARNAVTSLSSTMGPLGSGSANLDSGCSMTMTPDKHTVTDLKLGNTPICLANHSVVEATHRGLTRLPIRGNTAIKTLVVPALHKPLISIASLVEEGITCIFTKDSCELYSTNQVSVKGKIVVVSQSVSPATQSSVQSH
ncbi:hypothetical protein PSTG_05360 [Puccinia striiformis f. sp. tritici PST-78]|uniref:Retrovirus-related Pol polyprotein from transposon TNT 1-94-like beta-barrel domain-containing protein n=1 Tax=Puccinia striiformis f. sp. tritici PST-78 TaxID=1165861 RepID=A0A0L0VQV5_9BASI|nr:hypothetical protein PSTG_05360 [Puccinia striiformis f. sp. tritici PST-78]